LVRARGTVHSISDGNQGALMYIVNKNNSVFTSD